MTTTTRSTTRWLLAAGLAFAAATASAQPAPHYGPRHAQAHPGHRYAPSPPPPPPRYSHRPGARKGHVWMEGHWRWEGRRQVWVPGHWIKAPQHRPPPPHWRR